MTTLLAFLFVLGVLVFIHELGHFLAARRLGVRVLTFSVGFGPKIFSLKRGDTEYCVSLLPLGGYVKMAGESPDDPRTGAPDEFMSKSKWGRFQILVAGPLMNLVLAVVVMAVVLAQGAEVPVYENQPPVVAGVESNSPAALAGLQRGDLIQSVAGDDVSTWDDLFLAVGTRPDRDIELTFRRDGDVRTLMLRTTSETRFEIGNIGVLPEAHPVVRTVIEDRPADRAGLLPGDVVLSIDGEPVAFGQQLIDFTAESGGRELVMTVRRDGAERDIRVTPEAEGERMMIGITFSDETRAFQPTPIEAVQLSVQRNIEFSGLIFRTLGELVTGETSVRQLQGPVGIAQLSGESAEAGWVPLFSLMAILSVNLGILNLLPIPVLDGGHIAIMALEGLARRDFSIQVKEKMLLAGFVALMMLMVTVIYNDLTRVSWIEQLMPWRN